MFRVLVYLMQNNHHCLFSMPGGFSVFAGVGERTREGNDLYREMIESGVIKLGDKQVSILYPDTCSYPVWCYPLL